MEYPKRKRLRLPDFDYTTQGAYFVTLCTQDKKHLFQIDETDKVIPEPHIAHSLQNDEISMQNRIIHHWINEIHNKFQDVKVDKYVIMPNHIHLLLQITDKSSGNIIIGGDTPTTTIIAKLISTFKRFSHSELGFNIWQNRSNDHIVRDEDDYLRIWQYIDENPAKWEDDCFYKDFE